MSAFEDEQVSWLAAQCPKTAVTELMRIAWRTVGAINTLVHFGVHSPETLIALAMLTLGGHPPALPGRT